MVSKVYPDAPRVAAGAVVIHQDKVLLVLRGQDPNKGVWAIPGGRIELGESLQAAAEREVLEETGLRVQAGEIIYTFDRIEYDAAGKVKYHFVIIDMLAQALDPTQTLIPADDVVDAGWFTRADIETSNLPVSDITLALLQKIMNGQS